MIVSALYPRFRDVVDHLVACRRMALFYATPVLYPLWVVSSSTLRDIIALNPLTPIFDLAQQWITEPSAPWPGSAALGGPVRLAISLRDLRGGLRARGLGLPPRGAPDRGGSCSSPRRRASTLPGEQDRDERHRRHLPVPVERRVREVGDQSRRPAAAGGRGRAQGPRAAPKRDRRRGTRSSSASPTTPSSASVWSAERVGVLRELVDLPPAQPVDAPAAGADAAQRLGAERPQRDRPVVVAVALAATRAGSRPPKPRRVVPLVSCAPTTIASASPATDHGRRDQRRAPGQPQLAAGLAARQPGYWATAAATVITTSSPSAIAPCALARGQRCR